MKKKKSKAQNAKTDSNFDLLRCIKCGDSIHYRDRFLHCNRCNIVYPIHQNVPIMYIEGNTPEELKYSNRAIKNHSSPTTRKFKSNIFNKTIQTCKQIYSKINLILSNLSPARPEYHIKRINSFLPSAPRTILDVGGGSIL